MLNSRMNVNIPRRFERRSCAAGQQRGVVMIEVLVALLIFMLGVLGLVGLQTSMTRAQTDSKVRAEAVTLANDVIGRMWTDLDKLSDYDTKTSEASSASKCEALTRCTEWQNKVAKTLPGGSSAITVDTATGDVAVQLSWTTPAGDTHSYTTQTTISKAST